jgi:hypothetical protein
MAFYSYEDVLRDQFGRPVPGAYVSVINNSGGTAELFDEAGQPMTNPFKTDALGEYYFAVELAGRYIVEFRYGGRIVATNSIMLGDKAGVIEYDPNIDYEPGTVGFALDGKAQAAALGVSGTAENLGTFTGTIIPDNQTAKQALQALETATEDRPTSVVLASIDADNGAALVGLDVTKVYPEDSIGRYFTRELMLTAGPYNAPTDGTSDATAAIALWRGDAGNGTTLLAPGGDFRFSSPQDFGAVDNICVKGSSVRNTRFLYSGADTTVDMFTFGDAVTDTHFDLSDFSVDRLGSAAVMTDGYAIVVRGARSGWALRGVTPGANNGTVKIRNGFLFDNCNAGLCEGYSFRPIANGIVIIGKLGGDTGSDITLDKGLIIGGTDQIHVGGGFGGLVIQQHLGYGGETNLRIDESIVAQANREIMLSPACIFDAADIAHILVNVPSNNLLMDVRAWLSGAGFFTPNPGDGIRIQSMPNGRVSLSSGHIKGATRDGLRVEDATTEVIIAPETFITDNAGYGVNATVATSNVAVNGQVKYNTTGQIAPNVNWFKTEAPVVSSGGTGWAYSLPMKLRQQGNYLTVTGEVTCTTLGLASGGVTIALSRTIKTASIGMATNLNTGQMAYVRADAAGTSLTIQQEGGGAFPFTASGQVIRFKIDMEISQ